MQGAKAKDDGTTRHDMHFAVVADKLDLSSIERRLEKEKYNFNCVVNKLVYVTPTVRDNCAHADLFLIFFASRVFLRGTLCRVFRRNGNYKRSGVV